MKKNCFFITYDAYGDWYSVNGLVRYLSTNYKKLYLIVDYSSTLKKYATYEFVSSMFSDVKNIKVIKNNFFRIIIKIPFLNAEVVDTRFNENNKLKTTLKVYNKFNPVNKIKLLSNNNSNLFYNHLGIDDKIKFKFFSVPKLFFKNSYISEKVIICETYKNQINRKYLSEKDNLINLHNKFSNPLEIIPLVKKCEELHLIENSIALLIYFLSYNKIIFPRKVFLHLYARIDEKKRYPDELQKDRFFNMFLQPRLSNWNVIYE